MKNASSALSGILMLALTFSCDKGGDVRPVVLLTVGDVQVKSIGTPFAPARAAQTIMKGDIIKTGDASHITIQIGERGIVHIAPDSTLEATSLFDLGIGDLFLTRGTVVSNMHKLAKADSFWVKTPITIAAVRGTVFSVSHDSGACTVGVSRGRVQVTHVASGKEDLVVEGKAADIQQGITIRDLTRGETLVLRKAEIIAPIEGAQNMDPEKLEQKGGSYLRELEKIDREIEELSPATLENIRARYGRVDVVTLYSGKVYRGAILSRGGLMRMITPQGTVSIPAQRVKSINLQ